MNNRIKEIRKTFCNDSNIEFANTMGESRQSVNNWVREGYSIGTAVLIKLKDKFPTINLNWLLTGIGQMEIKESGPATEVNIDYKEKYYDLLEENRTLLKKYNELLESSLVKPRSKKGDKSDIEVA